MIRTALLAAALAAAPVAAAPLDEVVVALRATTTMTADFTQTAGNGTVSTGKLLLVRPGKIRFSYDKLPLLIVADGKRLVFVDYAVSQVSEWPIGSTPLGILLNPDADLSRVAKVTGTNNGAPQVTARDPKHPEYGVLSLAFSRDAAAPGGLALTGWTATDAQNNVTEIRLLNTHYNVRVASGSFSFRDPRTKQLPGKTF
jgi:outer membrane lipoprotein-sorting protein